MISNKYTPQALEAQLTFVTGCMPQRRPSRMTVIICVDDQGNLVYYDYGMMDELKPSVRKKEEGKPCGACLLGIMRGIHF